MKCCLLIHGFTGSPYEIEPLATYLKKQSDWKIEDITLPGHGEILKLNGVKAEEWISHAEQALVTLLKENEEVYVIGFSMGGMIASYLAVHYPVKKLVLLSAAAFYVSPKHFLSDIKEMIKDGWSGNLQGNELFKRLRKKIKYTPLSATVEFRKVVLKVRPLLNQVSVPTFIAQGNLDGVVPPKSANYLYREIGSNRKELFFLQEAKHVICHSKGVEELFQRVWSFLKE
ncbi:alpha/beta fold hydrolase [Bacillus spongiae]|uniref:Alpha/beta fold hydrolase n=1 Tax=Bacillus spongiae TaxID=2683610 RepID=A0ABU8HJ15_9BACI